MLHQGKMSGKVAPHGKIAGLVTTAADVPL